MNRRHHVRRRGAASVEMALSMIVLIPIFLYSVFLDDLLRYSLDAQEGALSTVWDYTVQDFTKAPTDVQRFARLTFCDHESGIDRPEAMTGGKYDDCEVPDHHKAVVAHVCWLNANAKQVTCQIDEGAGRSMDPRHQAFHSQYTRGGLVQCEARAVVENYMLPETFLPEFSKEKLTKKQWQNDSANAVHDNATAGEAGAGGMGGRIEGNAYFLKQQQMSVFTDTWALTQEADTEPGDKSGEMYDRVNFTYRTSEGYTNVVSEYPTFMQNITQDLLSMQYLPLFGADNILTPNLAIKPHTGATMPSIRVAQEGRGGSSSNYFTTEWRDWESNKSENIYNNSDRGDWYMGCKEAEQC
ncbi:hypothetical protein G4177_04765 [Corallococcus sp. ZKHCc1 1396]|uniref:Pilus assembly protein n=1 Tax=Corallococcus soli TaxID=2710757 RepID=A0ABR9PHU0_9BACT|nr:hypothetical protein [Corallococcus soli]MBE4747492.1 hypothetical protein [Corallococcus soli]